MSQIKDFVISLISAAAVAVIFEGIIPDGGLKKYFKYILALFLLVTLISPIKGIILTAANIGKGDLPNYEFAEAFSRANYIVAIHARDAVQEKFSISEGNITVKCDGEKIIFNIRRRIGLLADDIIYYTANNFGVSTEVIFYE